MIENTFTIKCEGSIVATNVPEYYVCMIIQSILVRFNKSAVEGDLKITIEAEQRDINYDDVELPF